MEACRRLEDAVSSEAVDVSFLMLAMELRDVSLCTIPFLLRLWLQVVRRGDVMTLGSSLCISKASFVPTPSMGCKLMCLPRLRGGPLTGLSRGGRTLVTTGEGRNTVVRVDLPSPVVSARAADKEGEASGEPEQPRLSADWRVPIIVLALEFGSRPWPSSLCAGRGEPVLAIAGVLGRERRGGETRPGSASTGLSVHAGSSAISLASPGLVGRDGSSVCLPRTLFLGSWFGSLISWDCLLVGGKEMDTGEGGVGLRTAPRQNFFLGAQPENGWTPREKRREKRLVRFVHPSGMSAHELLLARQRELDAASIRPIRSTADEIGLHAPKFQYTPRDRAVTPRAQDRRRRLAEISNPRTSADRFSLHAGMQMQAEGILSAAVARPSGVPLFGDGTDELAPRFPAVRATNMAVRSVTDTGRESHEAFRRKAHDDAVMDAVHHQFPSERQMETGDDSELDSIGGAMSMHKKLAGWYQGMTKGDEQYRSTGVYLEVKMRELLGDSWPEQSSGPDVVRASVCCDMLGRLIDSAPTIKELGHKLLDELVVSIFQARSAASSESDTLIAAKQRIQHRSLGNAEGKDAAQLAETVSKSEASAFRKANEVQDLRRQGLLDQWGEPYFVTVNKMSEEVIALTEKVKLLQMQVEDPESDEVRNRKMQSLIARLSGKALNQCIHVWKSLWQKSALLRTTRKKLRFRFRSDPLLLWSQSQTAFAMSNMCACVLCV